MSPMLKWWRWTGSPGSKPRPPKNSKTSPSSWITSTPCIWLGTAWNCVADASNSRPWATAAEPATCCTRLDARTLSTGADLLTDKQRQWISALFADDRHLEVEATWGVYQAMVDAYRDPDRSAGKTKMQQLIDALATGVPAALSEVRTLGRTLKQRAADVLAYFDRPGTSNGPTEAINGRLEHLRGSALGFRNLTDYVARSLLEAGGFRPGLHLRCDTPIDGCQAAAVTLAGLRASQMSG